MDDRDDDARRAFDEVHRARRSSIVVLALLTIVVVVMPMIVRAGAPEPTPTMLIHDLVLLPAFALAILSFAGARPLAWRWPRRWWIAAAVGLFVAGVWGHQLVFAGIDLSRDEQMASFDAAIFGSGRLVAPIAVAWRPLSLALNLLFILPVGDHAAWVSSYLPVNAALRALVATIADPVVTSPLLVVVGFLALGMIARRLWPGSRGSRTAALLCYACSSQVVVNGMTAFAMSAHLGLNLVWLWLFLRDDRAGVAGSLAVGFLATGAHQPLFHPLFALPFLAELVWRRRWGRAAAYAIGYAAITGFWIAWPVWMSGLGGVVPAANDLEGITYTARLQRALAHADVAAVWTMAANLFRFVTWQHLLLLPLALLGTAAGWQRWPQVRPLAVGVALPVIVMTLILPWQGHGWGYRYLHPVLGNLCLLAGYGWRRAEMLRVDLSRSMLATSVASVVLLLPAHAWSARSMALAQAIPDRAIAASPADVVVIDASPFTVNLVRNAPDLTNRPIRLGGEVLRAADIAGVCRGRRIAFVDAPRLATLYRRYNAVVPTAATPHQQALRRAARDAGCAIVSD